MSIPSVFHFFVVLCIHSFLCFTSSDFQLYKHNLPPAFISFSSFLPGCPFILSIHTYAFMDHTLKKNKLDVTVWFIKTVLVYALLGVSKAPYISVRLTLFPVTLNYSPPTPCILAETHWKYRRRWTGPNAWKQVKVETVSACTKFCNKNRIEEDSLCFFSNCKWERRTHHWNSEIKIFLKHFYFWLMMSRHISGNKKRKMNPPLQFFLSFFFLSDTYCCALDFTNISWKALSFERWMNMCRYICGLVVHGDSLCFVTVQFM